MRYEMQVEVEAVQWDATVHSWALVMAMHGIDWKPGEMGSGTFILVTSEGDRLVRKGDFVIKGAKGDFYSLGADIFKQTAKPISVQPEA